MRNLTHYLRPSNAKAFVYKNKDYVKSEGIAIMNMHVFGLSTTFILDAIDASDEINVAGTFAAKLLGFFIGKAISQTRERKKAIKSTTITTGISVLGPIAHWGEMKLGLDPIPAYFCSYPVFGSLAYGIRYYLDIKSGLIKKIKYAKP